MTTTASTLPRTMDKLAPTPSAGASSSAGVSRSASSSSFLQTPSRSIRSKHGSISGMNDLRIQRTPLKDFLFEEDGAESPLIAPDFHFPWMTQATEEQLGSTAIARAGDQIKSPRSRELPTPSRVRRTPSRGERDPPTAESIEERYRNLRLSPTISKRLRPQSADGVGATATPPSQVLPRASAHHHSQSQSNSSSASSARMMPLTEASSSSSLHPATPNGLARGPLSKVQTSTPGSGGGPSGKSGRMYGSNRMFSRVVSAPIAMKSVKEGESGAVEGPVHSNTWTSNGSSTTMRPPLMHTNSSSSVNDHTDTTKTMTKAVTGEITTRSRYVTPGHTDRIISSVSTTGRRAHGLSRFGGPARRVIAPEPSEEEEVLADVSKGPTDSPANTASPAMDSSTDAVQSTPPVENDGRSYHLSPMSEDPAEESRPSPTPQAIASHSSVHALQGRRNSPDPNEKPFRPFQSAVEMESGSLSYRHSTPHKVEPRSAYSAKSPRMESQPRLEGTRSPLAPARSLPTALPRPPSPKHELKASRPAPILEQENKQYLPVQPIDVVARTVPAPPIQSESQAQVQWTGNTQTLVNPAPVVQSNKRSYVVNSNAYERISILGKGGSSKVYSVLCPVKRTVFALKRVSLDRADAETCQGYTNEIELLKRLKGHDRIIQLIDHQITYTPNNRPKVLSIVMECGEIDFAALLDEQKGKMLNMSFVGLYWQQMLEAVHAVHLENVVHTDLKPANFVLVKGRLKIIDFGIAKAVANDTVNIQREQQIGTVNYMSPEAIQRMNNQKVLKLSYPSDVWSLGCILYQMIYGNPPYANIPGGPLPKMNAIADSSYQVHFPETSTPKTWNSSEPVPEVAVNPAAIDSMRRCLAYKKDQRLTIPELLHHEFLRPRIREPAVPPGSTTLTRQQMGLLVDYVLKYNNLPSLTPEDTTAEDLFSQLEAQNAITK